MQNLSTERDKFGRFIKGIKPWNKGTVGICKPKRTSFKISHKWPRHIEKKRIAHLYRCSPNLKSTKNLSYLLGVLKGDGYTNYSKKYNRCIIGLQNTKFEFCKIFANALKAINLNPSFGKNKKIKGVGKHKLYYVVANSQIFYKWYKKLSLPKLKKLLNAKGKKTAFIRGFYESEGTLYKDKNKIYHMGFINTNKNLLKMTKNILEEIGFDFHLNGPYQTMGLGKKPHYRLQTARREQIKNFLKVINPSIKRTFSYEPL